MKRTVLLLSMLVSLAAAQSLQSGGQQAPVPQVTATNIVEAVQAPTYSDIYCAGFISNQSLSKAVYVAAGLGAPHQTKFSDRDYVYLTGGSFQVGTRYAIVRELLDPNRYEVFKGQRMMLVGVGYPYAELGRVRVVAVQGSIGIAVVEFSCDAMVPGDVAAPFAEKAHPAFRGSHVFDRFAPPNGKLMGRIVMARDFDSVVGTGQKVYLNVGGSQGVKVGDYFRAVRTYESIRKDAVDGLSYQASYTEDTQRAAPTFPVYRVKELPRISLGEMVVLNVTPTSATAMITVALSEINLGDEVEMEEAPPPAAVAPALNPPTIACSANPTTVRQGETSTITCDANSPDNRPLSFSFTSSAGRLAPQGSTVGLDTSTAALGPVSVRSTVSDDRNLTASALNTVNVVAPAPAATASKVNEIQFKPNSAYVNNIAKAILDDIALRLQREPDSSATLVGFATPQEAKGLAERRAANARDYLTRTKGIDPRRVEVRTSTEAGRKVEIWIVPAGASMPQ